MTEEPTTDQSFEQRVTELTFVMLSLRQSQDKANEEFITKLGNLSLQQLNIINVIGTIAPCTMSEVADKVTVSLSSVTIIVDKLVKMGLIKRERCTKDRRVVYVNLSTKGKKIYDAQIEHIRERSKNLMSLLTEQEQVTFLNICKRFASAIIT